MYIRIYPANPVEAFVPSTGYVQEGGIIRSEERGVGRGGRHASASGAQV